MSEETGLKEEHEIMSALFEQQSIDIRDLMEEVTILHSSESNEIIELKAKNQALRETLKRSQQQRDDIYRDLVKAQEALKECLTLIDNEGLSPRGNLREKVAEAIQGEL